MDEKKFVALADVVAWKARDATRQRLGTAKCERCFFFELRPNGTGHCHQSVNTAEPEIGSRWWCELFLPRATDDPDPSGSDHLSDARIASGLLPE